MLYKISTGGHILGIKKFLEQYDWRLRAYLGAPSTEKTRVGWRHDPCFCPVAEWINFEELRAEDFLPGEHIKVDAEWIIWRNLRLATPPVLARFIDLIDAAELAECYWKSGSARVERAEALAALLLAERQVAQRLLPQRAESNRRCAYVDQAGQRCTNEAATPWMHSFMTWWPIGTPPPRQACREFAGAMCDAHWSHVVIPPDAWWHQECHARKVVPARRSTSESREPEVMLR